MKNIQFTVAVSALLLSSCTMTGGHPNALNGILSGHIVDWPADLKGGEVRLMSWFNDLTAATAPVDEQGNFTLKLGDLGATPDNLIKTSELLSKKTVIGDVCQGQGTATPDSGSFQVFSVVVWADGKPYGDVTLDKGPSFLVHQGDAEANLWYFTEPTSLSGSVTCPPPYDNSRFAAQYPAGWSLVRADLSLTPAGAWIYSYDPAAPLTGLSWRIFKEYGSVGVRVNAATMQLDVVAGQAAEKAGLKTGDVLVSVDGKPYLESGGLRGEPGSKVVLVVKRDGQDMTFEVTRAFTRVP